MRKRILMLLALFTAKSALAVAPVYTENKTAIPVSSDQPSFTIKLRSNPTTGYSWFVRDYDINFIQPIKHTYEAPENKMMGAPGSEVWIFHVKPAGFVIPTQTMIRFVYVRPWESSAPAQQLVFKVTTNKSR